MAGKSPSSLRSVRILGVLGGLLLLTGALFVAPLVSSLAGAQSPSTPTIQGTASIGVSGTISDTVQVVGNSAGAPTGNVTFYFCNTGSTQTLTPGPCLDAVGDQFGTFRLTTGANDTSTASSAGATPDAAGTWCFSVDYAGDSNYSPASDNTNDGNLDSNDCVLVTTGSSTSTSAISSVTVTLGPSGTVTDTVTVQGTLDEGSPTGTVDFYVCQISNTQTLTTGPCSASGTPQDTESLAAGVSPTSSATSAPFALTGAGTWCYSVVYSGDSNYSGSSDNTGSGNLDPDECVLVGQAGSTTTTIISSANVVLGPSGTVSDTVTVEGTPNGGPPTGSVDFYVCQLSTSQTPETGPCVPGDSPQSTESVQSQSEDTSTATSASFTPTSAGNWCFSAVYGGDPNYERSSDNTGAGNADPDECVLVAQGSSVTATVISSANVTIGPSGTVTDTVTVTGNSTGGPPTGSVDFYVCQAATSQTLQTGPCSPTGTPEDSPTLHEQSSDASGATSTSFAPTSAGTWCFSAVYGGDSNYTGSSDNTSAGNQDARECVLVAQAPSTTTSTVSSTVYVIGQSSPVTDTATVTGNSVGGAPAGAVDFYICGPNASNALCSSQSTPEGTPSLAASGAHAAQATSSAFSTSTPGTYCFAAVYVPSADGNYGASSDNVTGTVDPNECVLATPPYTFISADSAPATVGSSFTFTVKTAGMPTPTLKKSGKIPTGLTFVDNHNGTATFSGTPAAGKGGVYTPTWKAKFGSGNSAINVTQSFTLTVSEAPTISNPRSTPLTVHVGVPMTSYTIKTKAYPLDSIGESGSLPAGIQFQDNGDGTATISGTATGPAGNFPVTISASNGVGNPASETFTIEVKT